MPKVSPSKQDADPANPLAPWPPQATKYVDARPPPITGGGYSPMTATKVGERDLGFKNIVRNIDRARGAALNRTRKDWTGRTSAYCHAADHARHDLVRAAHARPRGDR